MQILGRIKKVYKKWTHKGLPYCYCQILTSDRALIFAQLQADPSDILGHYIYADGNTEDRGSGTVFYADRAGIASADLVPHDGRALFPETISGTILEITAPKVKTDAGARRVVLLDSRGKRRVLSGYGFNPDIKTGEQAVFTGNTFNAGTYGWQFWVDSTIAHGEHIEQTAGQRATTTGTSTRKVEGVIRSVVVSKDNGWKVISVRSGNKTLRLSGVMPDIRPGMDISAEGEWKEGIVAPTLNVSSYSTALPSRKEDIIDFLKEFIPGIGLTGAATIYDTFGDRTLETLFDNPKAVGKVNGLRNDQLRSVLKAFKDEGGYLRVSSELSFLGLGERRIRKIYGQMGTDALAFRDNPYLLSGKVKGIGFAVADQMGMLAGIRKDSPSRIEAGIRHKLTQAAQSGNVCLPEETLVAGVSKMLDLPSAMIQETLAKMLSESAPTVRRTGQMIYSQELYRAERRVTETLSGMASEKTSRRRLFRRELRFDRIEAELSAECGFPVKYDGKQREAVKMAASNRISIITGGPGTGKTMTTRAVIRALEADGGGVLLACPTGRAAKRMSDVTRRPASTVHRLLEFTDGRFKRNADNPLEGTAVIIDESSMLDIQLMDGLLEAIPKGMKVVFVGDVDQIPSVGPGTVFRDMIKSGRIPVTRLDTTHRQAKGSSIVTAAREINEGRAPDLDTQDGSDFLFIETGSNEQTAEKILELVRKGIPEKYGYSGDDIQVLTSMKKEGNVIAASDLNMAIREFRNGATDLPSFGRFRLGDRVMQTRNDYEKGVCNGNFGTVTDVDTANDRMTVTFEGIEESISYERDDLQDLDLAYAITIHKSQGSEFPCVIIPVGQSGSGDWMTDRNLLYTAVTRAKKQCILVGDKGAVPGIISRVSSDKRTSLLLGRLKGDIVDTQKIGIRKESFTVIKQKGDQEKDLPEIPPGIAEGKESAEKTAGKDPSRDRSRISVGFAGRRVYEKRLSSFKEEDRKELEIDGRLGRPYKPKEYLYVATIHPSRKETVLLEPLKDAFENIKKALPGQDFIKIVDLSRGKTVDFGKGPVAYDVFSGKVVPLAMENEVSIAEEETFAEDIRKVSLDDFIVSCEDGGNDTKTAIEMLMMTGRVDGCVEIDGGKFLAEIDRKDPDTVLLQETTSPVIREACRGIPSKEAGNMQFGYGYFDIEKQYRVYSIAEGAVVIGTSFEKAIGDALLKKEYEDIQARIRERIESAMGECKCKSIK